MAKKRPKVHYNLQKKLFGHTICAKIGRKPTGELLNRYGQRIPMKKNVQSANSKGYPKALKRIN